MFYKSDGQKLTLKKLTFSKLLLFRYGKSFTKSKKLSKFNWLYLVNKFNCFLLTFTLYFCAINLKKTNDCE